MKHRFIAAVLVLTLAFVASACSSGGGGGAVAGGDNVQLTGTVQVQGASNQSAPAAQ